MTKSRLFNDTPYLPFAPHETQLDAALDLPPGDVAVLRELACRYAEIAALPEQAERKARWRDVNGLRGGRPLLWVNEVCWHEMNVEDELTPRCESAVGFRLETVLRRQLYQWRHMRGDMVLENAVDAPFILTNSGFGLSVEADVAETDSESTIASRHFHNQIKTAEDIDKIQTPVVRVDERRTQAFYECYRDLFSGILPVRGRGCTGFWFAPWDDIVLYMGADNVLMNLVDDEELMLALIEKLTDAYLGALDQYEALGLTWSNNTNVRIGSGAYGYTNELPADGDGPCPLQSMWGSSTAQIFGSVSPAMHERFGLEFEKKWMARFGLNYYGCCEPLHARIGMLSKIPNLRKISISPWADAAAAAEAMRGRYVMSLKPSPAVLAGTGFDGDAVRRELEGKFEAARGVSVEVILKDISTVRGDPSRLWRWMDIAMDAARRCGE
jgi:hypothetical protein